MQRGEAIQVYKEICQCILDASLSNISLVSIDLNDFELRISMFLDPDSFRRVELIVKKHELAMKQDQGSLLICRLETKNNGMEITA
jgi:hypothetical protein